MNDADLKGFLYDHEELLRERNYDALYNALLEQKRSYLTSFLFKIAHRNPLEYMTSISDEMFNSIELDELTIPSNIKGGVITGLKCNKVIIEAPLNRSFNLRFFNCRLDKVILKDGIVSIPDSFMDACNVKFVKLPDSVVNLGKQAFKTADIIATNRREGSKRLVIPKKEIDFYKSHLKWFRDKEN